jgi:AbrB family looped-hinge helix DNA binding protein
MGRYFFGAVTIGERGQIVIPAHARQQCGMDPGDKLLVFYYPVCRGLMLAGVDQMNRVHELLRTFLEKADEVETGENETDD